MDIKKILVPVDFSDNSKKILDAAGYFSGKCEAQIHVVFVVQSFDDYLGFFGWQLEFGLLSYFR